MKSIANFSEQFSTLMENAKAIANQLESLREELPEDIWDDLENSPWDPLVCACMDLEDTLQQLLAE